jgi:indolepyruvate ferredoxin oxidoreductase
LIARRSACLADYQDAAYAARYRALIEKVRTAEAPLGSSRLTTAVAHNYSKLLAIKDEYEVARLYAETDFRAKLDEVFEGDYSLRFHLAPPLLAKPDPITGRPRKRVFGPWLMTVFRWLAKARRLRGTRWDLFGRSAERRAERQLITDYEDDINAILATLAPSRIENAVELASLPTRIRGYGPVKLRSIEAARPQRESLRTRLAA